MQIDETSSEGLKREYKVTVPHGDIEARMSGRLAEIARTVQLPGFRPGKAPVGLLRKKYGDSVRGEILEQTIQDSYQRTITEKGIRPALEPKIEIVTFKDGADLEYKMAVELFPEIVPPDFAKIALERLSAEAKPARIDQVLQQIAERNRQYETAAGREAADGDMVVVDFAGTIEGQPLQGGQAKGLSVLLGSKQFLPGFEDQLLGAKAGEKRTLKITLPDSWPNEAQRGKEALFETEVTDVKAPKPIVIDDAFAKTLGLDDLAALRRAVTEQIEREYRQVSRARLKRTLLDELAKRCEFAVPPGMVDREFEAIWQRLQQAKEAGQLDDDDKSLDEEALKKRYREIAERRVRLGLLIAEVGRQNSITVSQEEINRAMAERARMLPGQEQRVFEFYQKNPAAMQELQAPIFEDKVIDFIVAIAKIDEKKVSPTELMQDAEAVAEVGATA
jgi:trigger factor